MDTIEVMFLDEKEWDADEVSFCCHSGTHELLDYEE